MANVAAAMLARNSASISVLMRGSSCFSDKTVAIDSARATSAPASSGNGFVMIVGSFAFKLARFDSDPYLLIQAGSEIGQKKISLRL